MSFKFLKQITKECGREIATPEEMEKLRAWQAKYNRALETMNSHTDQAAKAAWVKHQEELRGHFDEENLHNVQARSYDHFCADFAEKMRLAKEELRHICKAAMPTCKKISERFIEAANDFVRETENAEMGLHLRFGVAYKTPSAVLVELKRAAAIAKQRIPEQQEYANASPESMCPYLEILNTK